MKKLASKDYDFCRFLRLLEKKTNLICPLKSQVQTLRLKASFLKVFLSCKGKWHIEYGNLKVLLNHIQTVFQDADLNLRRLCADMSQISSGKDECLPRNMDALLYSMLGRFQLLDSDFQEVYAVLSKSSRAILEINDQAAMENLNFLLENIEDLLRCKAESVAPLKEELEAVERRLRFLRNFLGFTAKRCIKFGKFKYLLVFAEVLADNISCLLYLCSVNDKINDQSVNKMKVQLLSELKKFSPTETDTREIYIRALRASKSALVNSNLVVKFGLGFLDSLKDYKLALLETKLQHMTSFKDKFLSLYDELWFLLTYFAMDSSEEHTENDQKIFKPLFESTIDMVNEIAYLIFSLHADQENEENGRELEMIERASDLLAIIMVAKADTRKMYESYVPKSLRSNFPKTNGLGFIGSLLQYLKELLSSKPCLVVPLMNHIEMVERELFCAREDLSKSTKLSSQQEELQSQWIRLIDAAYQTEYIIDSFLVGEISLCCHKLGLFDVIEETKTVKIELKAIRKKMRGPKQITQEADSSHNKGIRSLEERLADESSNLKLVIFGKEAEEIRERMTKGSEKLNIISIVGMPGIGKTRLACSVFQHSSNTYHFHVRARCTVSQIPEKTRLLREILQQVTFWSIEYSDDVLDQKLYQSLKGRRYLIFMDDVWDIRPLMEIIRTSFPDDGNGSRILFTSRFDEIASEIGLENINYHLSPISKDKSWEMLEFKIFENRGSCPPELVSVGREIAANCKGLPLTVDLIAGILRETETKEWEKVAESMMKHLFDDPQGRCQKVLELSYHNLPDELKPCFLYFAAFPEDAEIPTRKLILLWIAEGFFQPRKNDQRSLEDAAEDSLNNLISRNLVMVSKTRRLGGVKASHVHDLLHEFASGKAQEESFMLKIDGKANFSSSLSSHVLHQWEEPYRIIYSDNWKKFDGSASCCPRARTLICEIVDSDLISLQFSSFKLLRMLDISVSRSHGSSAIGTLIHLRFLAIDRLQSDLLSEICKLQNLETLIMAESSCVISLDEICNWKRLRHLCCGRYITLTFRSAKMLEKSFSLHNLRTVYKLWVNCQEDIKMILKLMPNLVKLKIGVLNPSKDSYSYPELNFLKKLESLKIGLAWPACPYRIISYPPYLRKLELLHLAMSWTEISRIGNLQHLEILKLKNGAFVGQIWAMTDGQFPKLRYLSLYKLDIEEWNASENHLSCLEILHVRKCRNLRELPSCLAEIATLREIKVRRCGISARNSALRIIEEQEDCGNDQLVADIGF